MKTAIITGGGGYIGSAIARNLAKTGVNVAIFEFDIAKGQKVAKGLGGNAYAVDISKYEEVKMAVAQVVEDFGTVDMLLNIAGWPARGRMKPFVEQDLEICHEIIELNLLGTFNCVHAVAPYMITQNRGSILNFSSAVAIGGMKNMADYAAAKAGVIAATKVWAIELGRNNINVNCISPGPVPHEGNGVKASIEMAHNTSVLNRVCNDEDVANLACFMVSDKAEFITGQNYIIDGGRSIGLRGAM